MVRPPTFSVQEKQRIVLSVLSGKRCSVAEAARRSNCSDLRPRSRSGAIGGLGALEASAAPWPFAA